jgi:cytochrome P450
VLRLDGDAHTKRRRLLNRLVLRDRHARLREEVLRPAIDRQMDAVFAGAGSDGRVRADLVAFCMRALLELNAAMIGLDAARTTQGLDELARLQADLEEFPRLRTQLRGAAPPLPEGEEGLRRALARFESAKREFVTRFYEPAFASRRELVARSASGEIAEASLPTDFLTLVAAHADPAIDGDVDLPVRHAIMDFLHAGTGTTVGAVVRTIDELDRWWSEHPEDRERRDDPPFLASAVNEVLRLHSANPAEVRRAVQDVTLCRGTVVRAGQYVALRTGFANRDVAAFGPDAERFDPDRVVPAGTYPYGVAFGSGPHMCYGLPLAIGNDGTDGNIVLILRRLYEAGVRKDPERAARYRPAIAHADLKSFESYPVVLGAS